jgi:predicted SAM-dependent methyltransferase
MKNTLSMAFKTLLIHNIKRLKLFIRLFFKQKIKLNIGSSGINIDKTWIASDIQNFNITIQKDWKKNLLCFKADNILAEHVWEHLTEYDQIIANKLCYKFLKKGGKIRIAVPDGFFPDIEYINAVKPQGTGLGASDHKVLFNYKSLAKSLEDAGFKTFLIEYWDENKKFINNTLDEKDGYIQRSLKNDLRNKNGTIKYTSLIIDGIKL